MELEPVDGRAPITALDESSLDLNTSYAQILHLIEGSPKVVEFGCGAGSLARFLTQRRCTVIGVDLDAEAASVAREFCADVLIADLDETTPLKLFPTERFDVAILGGILERLRKPERLLAETSRVLRPGGYVIASLHNAGHGAIRLAMLKGQVREMKASFTLKGVEALFGDAGFFIETVARTTAPVFEADSPLVPRLERTNFNESIVAEVEGDPEAESVQFIVKALPASSAAARNIENQRRVESLEQRIAQLEEQLADSQAQLSAKLDAPTTQHLEEVQRQLHVAIFGPEGVEALQAQLQQRNDELTALREQMTTLAAREESTARREAKLAKENLDALDVSAELRKTLEEREATIATLRGELDVAATTIRQRSGELSKIADREKQIERERASAFAALDEVRRDVTAMRQ
ncbi:MAG: methyltransferase domain-containing protein, partial [Candidatus Eremiobacteraeota bacterium]|nr:methyltransferase domain-containing protein [Candidatus Eremiobacteraeota bacterium]